MTIERFLKTWLSYKINYIQINPMWRTNQYTHNERITTRDKTIETVSSARQLRVKTRNPHQAWENIQPVSSAGKYTASGNYATRVKRGKTCNPCQAEKYATCVKRRRTRVTHLSFKIEFALRWVEREVWSEFLRHGARFFKAITAQ